MRTGLLAVRGLRSTQPAEASGSPRSLRSCAAAAACALAAVLVISRNAVPYSAEPAELFGLDLASPWSPAGGPPAPETSLARQMQLGRGLAVVESPIATSQLVSAAIRATRSERGALAQERQAEDGLETELAVAKRGNDGTGIFADATADPSTLSDKELRASIVRLEGNLKTLQGKHARKNMKPSLAREPSEAHEIGAVEPSETQELRAIQQTLKALPKMLMREMMGFKMQMLGYTAANEGAGANEGDLPAAKTDDGVEISDKKHCLEPNVWVAGKCNGDPRGRKSTELERQAACNGGETAPSCKTFKVRLAREVDAYERALKKSSDYSYADRGRDSSRGALAKGYTGSSQASIDRLDREVKQLDAFASNLNPNEFVHVPQRFPHKDGADLGDNYIGSMDDQHGDYDESDDHHALASEAQMKQPAELATFFGPGYTQSRPEFASRKVSKKDLKRISRDPSLRKYANSENSFGKHSPLNPALLKMLYGNVAFQKNKFGIPADIMPSSKQYQAQVQPRSPRKKRNKLRKKMKQRWRKLSKLCVGDQCTWRPVLEDAHKDCNKKDCSEKCKGASCGEKKPPVKMCGPLGCSSTLVTPHDKADDPLYDQFRWGGLDGQADPLGIEAGLGDDEEPAEGVAADIALRSHFRVNGGEPIGDLALRGWQMPNGVDFEGANTLNPNEKNLIEER